MATSAPNDGDTLLEAQAQAMAEKALASLPPAERAARIGKVKEGIFAKLKAKAAAPPPAVPKMVAQGQPGAPATSLPPPPAGRENASSSAAPPPPPAATLIAPVEKLKGVEMCGDEQWFAEESVRRSLQEKVIAAHAEQKILVGVPADEIKRICPGGGRILGAGGVLRLGGSHLGGYGETDIAYAYRQLSRALHPDKNPGIPEAGDAFRRLSEAADELRQGLTEARSVLKTMCESLGGTVTPQMLERPQEALFAEATRVLNAVLGLTGEGEVTDLGLTQALAAFHASGKYYTCQARALLTLWYERTHLLDAFATTPLRTAYDCAPKRLRAQFLCLLNRATLTEDKRLGALRTSWSMVLMQYPELGLVRDLREKIRARCWIKDKASKWDAAAVEPKLTPWASAWRENIRDVLKRDLNVAVSRTDAGFRKLALALWVDLTSTWRQQGDAEVERPLELFKSDRSDGGLTTNGNYDEWAFLPAVDLLLIVAEGSVGVTQDGVFLSGQYGVKPPEKKEEELDKDKEKNDDVKKKDRSPRKEKAEPLVQDPNWESMWRAKMMTQKFRSSGGGGRGDWTRGHSPLRRRRGSSSRSRSRDRNRRQRRGRDRRRRSRSSS
jgi:hypothetical protein